MSERPVHIESRPEIYNLSQCSCNDCDSLKCFIKRQGNGPHSPSKSCSKTCMFYNNKMVPDGSRSDVYNIIQLAPKYNELNDIYENETNIKTRYSHTWNTKVDSSNGTDGELPAYPNVTVNRTELSSSTAHLSAQIMNMPYAEFKNSLSFNQNAPNSTVLSKLDILKRIKEAYQACSCRVCECIATIGSAAQSETCNCTPCQCDDCVNLRSSIERNTHKSSHYKSIAPNSCPKANKTCRQSRYVNYPKSASVPCDCKPCECVDCKSMGVNNPNMTIIVAPVGEDNQRMVCSCSPCDCLQCGNAYGSIATSRTREMSTGVSRHRNCVCDTCLSDACDQEGTEMCACRRNDKIMRKPVQRDSQDYDIRRAMVTRDPNLLHNTDQGQNNTVTMYAALFNSYPRPHDSTGCCCSPCECLKCKRKDSRPNQENKPQLYTHRGDCRCKLCECVECERTKDNTNARIISSEEICQTNTYNINQISHSLRKVPVSSVNFPKNANSEQYVHVDKTDHSYLSTNSNSFIYRIHHNTSYIEHPVKLGEPLELTKTAMETIQIPHKKQLRVDGNNGQQYQAISKSEGIYSMKPCNNKISDSSSAVHCQGSDNYISAVSSCVTVSRDVTQKDSNKKQVAHSSIPSSCNSSGRDDSNYLIRFPRTPAEACINDVMKLNLDQKLSLSRINVSSLRSDIECSNPPQYSWNCLKRSQCNIKTVDEIHNIVHSKCNCKPCDCEKCIFSKDKLKRCQCQCYMCNCHGTCLSENQSICIKKNEGTQTIIMLDAQNPTVYNRKVMALYSPFQSLYTKEFELRKGNSGGYTSNLDEQGTKLSTPYIFCSHESHSNEKTFASEAPLTIGSESANKTIKEAKAFSEELLKILESYEKANREFESVAKKIKMSQDKIIELKESNEADVEKDPNIIRDNILSEEKEVVDDLKRPIVFDENMCTGSSEIVESDTRKEIFDDSETKELRNKCRKYRKLIKRASILAKRFNLKTTSRNSLCQSVASGNSKFDLTLDERRDIGTEVRSIQPSIDTLTRQSFETIDEASEIKQLPYSIARSNIFECSGNILRLPIDIPIQNKEHTEKSEKSLSINNENKQPIKSHNLPNEDKVPCEIVSFLAGKETIQTISSDMTASRVLIKNDLSKEFRSVKSISSASQTYHMQKSVEKEVGCSEKDISIAILQRHFREFNSIPLFPQSRNSNTIEVPRSPSLQAATYSGDGLKVTFQSVRKVSDHTILVKWSVPHNTKNVKGYELLVDGRAVQKALNPNRRMAVVTCLPHSDRVLITIRTVAITGTCPSTTIIYRNVK